VGALIRAATTQPFDGLFTPYVTGGNMTPTPIACPFCSKNLVVGSGQTHCHHCHKELPANIRALLKSAFAQSDTTLRCKFCGNEISATATECGRCGGGTAYGLAVEDEVTPTVAASPPSKRTSSPALKRYLDLYRAARLLNGLGTTVKIVGIVVAVVIFVFWFILGIASAQGRSSGPFGPDPATQSAAQAVAFFICVAIGVVFGALIGGLFFLMGVLISAQGQLLMAHADSAVHTSPFLTDEERATAMSLPYTAPVAAAGVG
jgi:hypothetical protein